MAPRAHRRKAVGVRQQFVLPLRKCRIPIIECRQDPIFYGVSDNAGRFWDLDHAAAVLGFRPTDRAPLPGE